jgi:ribose-phosphate pyrophosphokinase
MTPAVQNIAPSGGLFDLAPSGARRSEAVAEGEPPLLLSGSAHPALAEAVAAHLREPLALADVGRFADGEVRIRLGANLRRRDVFVLQPTGPLVNDNLVELLALVDACRRAAARWITAVIPYFGYARQDKAVAREPITARMTADLLTRVGVDQVVVLDLHSPQVQGFFDCPVAHISALGVLVEALRQERIEEAVVVSPDAGFVKQAGRFAAALGVPLAVTHKERLATGEVTAGTLVGEVRDRRPIIVDDMITTGGTILRCLETLLQAGARPEATVAVTHGVFVDPAASVLSHWGIRRILVTDSLPRSEEAAELGVRVVSVAPLLAEAIRRCHTGESVREISQPSPA